MPIISTDAQWRLSGGASNADPAASLGGAKSSTAVPANLFDDVSSAEADAGDTEYRCLYLHNDHATLTWYGVKVWIETNTPSPDTTAAIGLGSSAIGGTEQTVTNEDTAPAGVTFSSPANQAAGLSVGDIPPGSHKALWIRRTVDAGASIYSDSLTLAVIGDTNP